MQKVTPLRIKKPASTYTELSKKNFINDLKCMYWAEKHLLKFLQRAGRAASTKYLKASFNGHFAATVQHVSRLERIFDLLKEKKNSKVCNEMDALITDAVAHIKTTEKNTLSRDLGLINLAEKIEHLEIKKYNNLISQGNDLGNIEIVLLLEETLIEEQEAEETFAAVLQDTLIDEIFKTVSDSADSEEDVEELEAV